MPDLDALRRRLAAAREQQVKPRKHMPSYYTGKNGEELNDTITAHALSYNRGCIAKYIVRMGRKDGEQEREALNKALRYAELEKRGPKFLTAEGVQVAFSLSDEQAAALQACFTGSNEELLAALRVLETTLSPLEMTLLSVPEETHTNAPPESDGPEAA